MRKTHRTKEERERLLDKYLESGLSRRAWCMANNIPQSTLITWEKAFNKEQKEEVIFIKPKSNVEIEKSRSFNAVLEIEGCKLHLNEGTPPSFISQIIKAVRESYV